jgi:hypothetical protein
LSINVRAIVPVTAATLFVSSVFAGTALAARQSGDEGTHSTTTASSAAPLTKQQVRKIAKRQVTKMAPGLSVARAKTADTATSAGTAKTADTAKTARLLEGFAASDLVRASSGSAGSATDPCTGSPIANDFASATFASLLDKTVAAPKAGVLMVTATVVAERDSDVAGTGRFLVRTIMDGAQIGGTGEVVLEAGSTSACDDAKTTTIHAVVPVSAGSRHLAVQLRRTDGPGAAYVGYANISTLFVPFGSSGAQGSLQ